MADYHPELVGPKQNSGLPDRLPIRTTTGSSATSPYLSTEQLQLVREEVLEMIQKGAVEKTIHMNGLYPNLFLVPKRTGAND